MLAFAASDYNSGGCRPIAQAAPGLENRRGANHCFLNVVIQVLYSSTHFRKLILEASAHPHSALLGPTAALSSCAESDLSDEEGALALGACLLALGGRSPVGAEGAFPIPGGAGRCCFCALQELFQQLSRADAEAVTGGSGEPSPDVLRIALSKVYNSRNRFQLGAMEDATETIEALLDFLHACRVPAREDRGVDARGVDVSASGSANVNECFSDTTAMDCDVNASSEAGSSMQSSRALEWRQGRKLSHADRIEEASAFGCHPVCPAHEVFGIEHVDISRCSFCGATGEPVVTSSFSYSVYVEELLAAGLVASKPLSASLAGQVAPGSGYAVASSLSSAGGDSTLQPTLRSLCQRRLEGSRCKECSSLHTLCTERWLTRRPIVFILSLVWPSDRHKGLIKLLTALDPQISMEQVFRLGDGCDIASASLKRCSTSETASSSAAEGVLNNEGEEAFLLFGLVCFRGQHYVAVIWSWPKKTWLVYDDTDVTERKDWSSVVSLLSQENLLPTLVLYELVSNSSVPASDREAFCAQVRAFEERSSSCGFM